MSYNYDEHKQQLQSHQKCGKKMQSRIGSLYHVYTDETTKLKVLEFS